MKRPSLEEVQEYFKDAKEVQSPNESDIVDITISIIKDIHEWAHEYWIDLYNKHYTGQNVLLWDKNYGYAKILTYKNNDMKITKEQILQVAHNARHENNSLIVDNLRAWFPDVFKVDYNEPILSLNDLLSVWDNANEIELYKTAPLFKNFERLAEKKIKII